MNRRLVHPVSVGLVIVLMPLINGMLSMRGTDLRDPYDHFELALSNYLPLLFPLLASLLYAPRVALETAQNFASPAQARLGRRRYVLGHVTQAAAWGFAVFATSILATWIYTMYIAPHAGTLYVPQGDSLDPSSRTTFGQLMHVSPVVYVVFYAAWVGLHGALYSVAAVICVYLIGQRVVALATPMVVVFVADFALAVLGLERFTLTGAPFPGSMDQGPMWAPLITTCLIICVIASATRRSLRTDIIPAGFA